MPDPQSPATPESSQVPAEPKGSPDTSSDEYKELVGDIANQVRGSLGLKDGQDIPSMVTGSTRRAVADSLGLEKGQDAKSYFTSIVQDAMKPAAPTSPSSDGKDDPNEGMRKDFEGMKTTLQKLQVEREQAKTEVAQERRKSAIHDALDAFDIRPEVKPMLTKAFVQGIEGPRMDLNDDGGLVIEGENGHPQEAAAFLKGYFEENRWALSQFKATGSGARGRGGATPPASGFDVNKASDRDGGGFDDAYKTDPEGTLSALQEANAEKMKRMGM